MPTKDGHRYSDKDADDMGKGYSLPVTAADKKLSHRHHKDSIAFNMRHAKDHEKEAKKHAKALVKLGKKG